jgi:septum formation protein
VTLGNYTELILASTSSARKALLSTLGLTFRTEAPNVDEVYASGTAPRDAAVQLAERKARAVALRNPTALVIGSDQLVDLDGEALGKPETLDAARTQLSRMLGRKHQLVTGLCMMGPGFFASELDVAELEIFPLPADELEAYLATNEWQGCAGSYRIEGRGQALFKDLRGDRTSIQGLPMARVVRLLREAGVRAF